MNTHYALLIFGGDFDNDHPDEELRGHGPEMTMIAAGPEEFCWRALADWTAKRPLRRDESAEVVTRDPNVVADGQLAADTWLEGLREAERRRLAGEDG